MHRLLLLLAVVTVAVVLAFPLTIRDFTIETASLSRRSNATEKVGYVDVTVATVWTNQHKPRPVDAAALTNPAHIEEWLHSMTTAQYLNLTSADRTQTQAVYGTRLNILDYQDGWYEVAVTGQPTPKNTLGYPGWVPAAQISFDQGYGALQDSKPFAEVNKAPSAMLYRDAAMTDRFLNISYDTRLPVIGQMGHAIQVAVPDGGSAYVSSDAATVYKSVSEIPYPTGQDLVESVRMFLGRPYLWGGASGYAFDCSGLTHTMYDAHGITIARDSDAQADFTGHGTNVTRADLQPGDLIFYATQLDDPSTIYHVAMYAGNQEMVEAYGAGVPVRTTPVRYNSDYWGAQRYLTH